MADLGSSALSNTAGFGGMSGPVGADLGSIGLSFLSPPAPPDGGAVRAGGLMSLSIATADFVPLYAVMTTIAGVLKTGGTVLVQIRRGSDGKIYDHADATFRDSGWTTKQAAMTEVSAANDPGGYKFDWDTGPIANVNNYDTYSVRADCTGCIPYTWDLKVTRQLDRIDVASSTLATAAAVAALPTAAGIADAVWDEAVADHAGGGTTGLAVNSAPALAVINSNISAVNLNVIAVPGAVWDVSVLAHTTLNTTGERIGWVDVAVSSRPTADNNRDSLLAAVLSGYTTPGTVGAALGSELVDSVWSTDISAKFNVSKASGALNFVRMLSTNRLEATPGDPGSLVLYMDDGTTVRYTYTLRDYLGGAVIDSTGSPARRGTGTP